MINKTELLSELQKNVQAAPVEETPVRLPRAGRKAAPKAITAEAAPAEANARQFTGKPIAFWGDDEDRLILRELALVLYQAGFKASESLAIRAALRLVHHDRRFVEVVEQARAVLDRDGRKLRHQK